MIHVTGSTAVSPGIRLGLAQVAVAIAALTATGAVFFDLSTPAAGTGIDVAQSYPALYVFRDQPGV